METIFAAMVSHFDVININEISEYVLRMSGISYVIRGEFFIIGGQAYRWNVNADGAKVFSLNNSYEKHLLQTEIDLTEEALEFYQGDPEADEETVVAASYSEEALEFYQNCMNQFD